MHSYLISRNLPYGMEHNKSTLSEKPRRLPRPLDEITRNALALYRLERSLTYKKLAALIGVDYSTLYRGLNGKGLHDTVIYKIERFLESLRAPNFK